jgi:hypothetical protein
MEAREFDPAPAQYRPWSLLRPGNERQGVKELLATFEPITLAQMDAVRLMDRSEVKYLFPRRLLLPTLAQLKESYRVFVTAEQPWSHNRTLYYDTEDMALYLRHHAGAAQRYKVRTREYVDSRIAFLEVKRKIGPCRTIKERIPIAEPAARLRGAAADFVEGICPYPADTLRPKLGNSGTRITLVSKRHAERVTLDIDLAFATDTERTVFPGVVVAEVKYEGRHESEFIQTMRRLHVRETSFSKYCVGVSMLYPEIKHNKFKAKQRLVARLAQGASNGLF